MFALLSSSRSRASRDPLGVDYQCYAAITDDGGADHPVDAAVVRLEGLDDHLPLPEQFVHEQPNPPRRGIDDAHDRTRRIGRFDGNAELAMESNERYGVASNAHHLARSENGFDVLWFQAK